MENRNVRQQASEASSLVIVTQLQLCSYNRIHASPDDRDFRVLNPPAPCLGREKHAFQSDDYKRLFGRLYGVAQRGSIICRQDSDTAEALIRVAHHNPGWQHPCRCGRNGNAPYISQRANRLGGLGRDLDDTEVGQGPAAAYEVRRVESLGKGYSCHQMCSSWKPPSSLGCRIINFPQKGRHCAAPGPLYGKTVVPLAKAPPRLREVP